MAPKRGLVSPLNAVIDQQTSTSRMLLFVMVIRAISYGCLGSKSFERIRGDLYTTII